MTGTARSSAELDVRRRRVLYRAWHRGTREMDLIIGRFTDDAIVGFDEGELADYERLMEVPDPDLYAWVTGERPPLAEFDTPVFRRLRAFHLG
jgi:antitoxin CptB